MRRHSQAFLLGSGEGSRGVTHKVSVGQQVQEDMGQLGRRWRLEASSGWL